MNHLFDRTLIVRILVFFFGAVALFLATYLYIMPINETYVQNINATKSKITAKRAEVNRLIMEHAELTKSIKEFNLLKLKGFFNSQDRVTAREMMHEIARQSGISKIELTLPPAAVVRSPQATDANHTLLSGNMKFKVSSLSDRNIFKLIVVLLKSFPGYLEFKDMKIRRVGNFSQDVLLNAAGDNLPSLVDADINFVWWTMASDAQMKSSPYFNPAAAAESNAGQEGGTP